MHEWKPFAELGPEGSDAGGGQEPQPIEAPAPEEAAPEAEKPSMLDAIKSALVTEEKPPVEKPVEAKKPEEKPVKEEVKPAPKDLSPQGQARFKELVSEIKTKEEAIRDLSERVKAQEGFLEVAKQVGAGPQEMGMFFEFMGHLNGGRPQEAIKFLESQIGLIAKEYGLAAGGNEDALLSRHPDLKEELDSYRITRERALEIAQSREMGSRRQEQDTRRAQQEESARVAKETEDKAIDSITKWATDVSTKDIDWSRKKEVLFGQLAQIVDGVAPDRWLAKIQAAYQLMGPLKEQPPRPGDVKRAQPLRASTGSGAPQAGSMFEAIKGGLDNMRAG
ncbi:MAG: hypothetical protein IT349_19290 [Candidatus Eisenbacteria bacterium]|nr:hypothetical protein [Candidatus Eisenbacteria bacterium]